MRRFYLYLKYSIIFLLLYKSLFLLQYSYAFWTEPIGIPASKNGSPGIRRGTGLICFSFFISSIKNLFVCIASFKRIPAFFVFPSNTAKATSPNLNSIEKSSLYFFIIFLLHRSSLILNMFQVECILHLDYHFH